MLVLGISMTMLMTGFSDMSIGRANCQACKIKLVKKVLFLRLFLFILDLYNMKKGVLWGF
ncbi:hypothetical protein RsY01_900 [Lactococcus reticulitermitis]|uniref:Uncharacterized protein n=1 Tax=Pseudolactococcus reticulitermitis TaxID=2025039 RepID=A0A224XCE8_9LACT|nr:hypothetical protein RsY01_900 [Lactococcus reticulitermitis]